MENKAALRYANSEILLIAICIIAAGALRFHNIAAESIWYDEAVSVKIAAAPILDVISGRTRDLGNPPLFPMLLHFWMRAFGSGETAARALPAFFNIISCIPLYALAKKFFNRKVAIIALLIFVISPVHIFLSQEVRTFTLTTFLVLMSMLSLVSFLDRRSTSALLSYVFFSTLGIYSHYFCSFIILAQNCYVFTIGIKSKDWDILRRWIAAQILTACAFLLFWGGAFIGQLMVPGNLSRASRTWPYHLGLVPLYYAVGTSLVWKDSPIREVVMYIPLVLGVFGIPFLLGLVSAWTRIRRFILLSAWLFFPVIVPAAISFMFSPMYYSRYSLMSTPIYYMFIAYGLTSFHGFMIKIVFFAAIVCISIFTLTRLYAVQEKHDWRETAKYISSRAKAGDVVLFDADIGETPFSYYYRGAAHLIRLKPNPDRYTVDIPSDIFKAVNVLLVRSDEHTDGADDYYYDLLKRYFVIADTKSVRGITTVLFNNRSVYGSVGSLTHAPVDKLLSA